MSSPNCREFEGVHHAVFSSVLGGPLCSLSVPWDMIQRR